MRQQIQQHQDPEIFGLNRKRQKDRNSRRQANQAKSKRKRRRDSPAPFREVAV
jgi:hypothetical protein